MLDLVKADRLFVGRAPPWRFTHANDHDHNRNEPGNDREPEDAAEIIIEDDHQENREQRADNGAYGVQRLAQAIGRAARTARHQIADEGIARCVADAFADAVRKARGKYEGWRRGDGKQRFGQRGEAIADRGQDFAIAQPVAQPAGEKFRNRGGGFAHALDQAHDLGACTQHGGEKHRQQPVDHLR